MDSIQHAHSDNLKLMKTPKHIKLDLFQKSEFFPTLQQTHDIFQY